MINVLAFPSASGVAQEIYNALKFHKDIKLYGANSGNNNPGKFLFESSYIGDAPLMVDTDKCVEWLNSIILKYKIHCIFPCYDDAQLWLKTNESKLLPVKIITSCKETTEICRSKKKTYEHFHSIIACPKVFSDKNSILNNYPVFIKPECGEGSKGCYKIDSLEMMNKNFTADHIILEYLPGEEYTVDCFTDISGNLSFVGARVRSMTRAGISIITENIDDADCEFFAMAEKINMNLKFIGAWFFQVKRSTVGNLCLMEIAPRIAGAMFLYRQQGVNFPLLSIYTHMGLSTGIIKQKFEIVVGCKIYTNNFFIPQFITNPIKAFYMDLDDTLILSNQSINPSMISLLYEAKLSNISTYLITRHTGIVLNTLEKYSIHPNLFCKIIHITDKSNKSDHVLVKPALFIDDSFSERNNTVCNDIYVFDTDSYEIIRDIIKISHSRFRITHE